MVEPIRLVTQKPLKTRRRENAELKGELRALLANLNIGVYPTWVTWPNFDAPSRRVFLMGPGRDKPLVIVPMVPARIIFGPSWDDHEMINVTLLGSLPNITMLLAQKGILAVSYRGDKIGLVMFARKLLERLQKR